MIVRRGIVLLFLVLPIFAAQDPAPQAQGPDAPARSVDPPVPVRDVPSEADRVDPSPGANTVDPPVPPQEPRSNADRVEPSAPGASVEQSVPDQRPEREVSLSVKKFALNFFSDQKKIYYTYPKELVEGKHWKATLAVAGATAGLVLAVDPWQGKMVRRNASHFDDFNNFLSENTTTRSTLLAPAIFYAAGLIKKDSYLKRTGLLAAEAWVDIDILDIAFRSTFRRTRPMDVPPNGNFKDTWFKTKANPLESAGSFPSGHTGWAFAIATVVARRHGQHHRWVPFVAYGLATVSSLSRFTSPNHFAGDAFFGAVLGYSVGRFVVLRQ
jgi:membrane-associated phospholipid phosphatase